MFTKKKEEALNSEIACLKHELTELKEIVKTQELIKLRAENARLKEIEQLVGKVRFKVKSVAYAEEENKVLVKYEIPNIKLDLDSENNPIKNDFFYSVNKLQLISFEDMKKIQVVLSEIKEKNKK